MVKDALRATLDLVQEGSAETVICELVKFRSFIQLAPGEPMKGDTLHSLQLGPRIAEDLISRTGRFRIAIHLGISPLSLFCPEPSIFLWRETFETFKEFARQASPPFGVEFEGLCFQFFETHAAILHQNGFVETAILGCGWVADSLENGTLLALHGLTNSLISFILLRVTWISKPVTHPKILPHNHWIFQHVWRDWGRHDRKRLRLGCGFASEWPVDDPSWLRELIALLDSPWCHRYFETRHSPRARRP